MTGDGPSLIADAEAGNTFAIAMVAKAPKLDHPYLWDAFNALSTERHYAMGPAPIPVSIMEAYARRDRLSIIETDMFVFVMRCLDNHFLKKVSDKNKREGG